MENGQRGIGLAPFKEGRLRFEGSAVLGKLSLSGATGCEGAGEIADADIGL